MTRPERRTGRSPNCNVSPRLKKKIYIWKLGKYLEKKYLKKFWKLEHFLNALINPHNIIYNVIHILRPSISHYTLYTSVVHRRCLLFTSSILVQTKVSEFSISQKWPQKLQCAMLKVVLWSNFYPLIFWAYHVEFHERMKTPFTVCKYLH